MAQLTAAAAITGLLSPSRLITVTALVMDAHLRDLRVFIVVAEELNFTRAAERLAPGAAVAQLGRPHRRAAPPRC